MKKLISSLIGGLAGSVALNILHQTAKQFDRDAPRIDLVGEEALSKGMEKMGMTPPAGDRLFAATMAADLVSNAAYYGMIGSAKKKNLLCAGAAVGLVAGIGAVTLPAKMGLDDAPVTRTIKTTWLTIAWYTVGGIVAGSVIKALRE